MVGELPPGRYERQIRNTEIPLRGRNRVVPAAPRPGSRHAARCFHLGQKLCGHYRARNRRIAYLSFLGSGRTRDASLCSEAGRESSPRRQTSMTRITLAAVLLAAIAVSHDARALETPQQFAKNCEVLEVAIKGKRQKLQIPKASPALLCWGYMQAMQDISALADHDGRRIAG